MKLLTSASFLSLIFAVQSAFASGPGEGNGGTVPEPGVLALLAIGGISVAAIRYFKK